MLQLERRQVDTNLDFALQDLSAKLEGKVSDKVSSRLYDASLPEMALSMSECLHRYFAHKKTGDEDKDRLQKTL